MTSSRSVGVVLSAALLIICAAAAADEERAPPCTRETIAWVDLAARSISIPTHAVVCRSSSVRLRLDVIDGQAIDVEIADPPGPAFTHAGRLRVSPIVEVADYQTIPLAQRQAVDRLTKWLQANEPIVVFTVPDQLGVVGPILHALGWRFVGPWLFLFALSMVVAATFVRRTTRQSEPSWGRSDSQLAAMLAVGAAGLRLTLGVWGPHHIHGLGAMWVTGAIERSALAPYGPGYAELFGGLVQWFRTTPDRAIFAANAGASAAASPLVFALSLALGSSRRRSLLAGLIVAIDPISISVGATESYFTAITTLVVACCLLWAWVGALAAERAWATAGLAALAGALLSVTAGRIHPVAWPAIAIAPLVIYPAVGARGSGPRRLAPIVVTVLGIILVGAIAVATSGKVIAEQAAEVVRYSVTSRAGCWIELAVIIGTLGVITLVPRLPAILVPTVPFVATLLLTHHSYGQAPTLEAVYCRLFEAVPLVAIFSLLPQLGPASRWAEVVGAGLLAAVVLRWSPVVFRRTAEQVEYRWLRDEIRQLAPGCRLAFVGRAGRRSIALPDYRWAASGSHPDWLTLTTPRDVASALGSNACLYYVHSSFCSSSEGQPACDGLEHETKLSISAHASMPAVSEDAAYEFHGATVDVFIARVGGMQNELGGAP